MDVYPKNRSNMIILDFLRVAFSSFLLSPSSLIPQTANSRSQWALPDINRELPIAVGTLAPQPRAQWRTSTASSRLQWALPDFNRELQISMGTGPPLQAPDLNINGHCRTSTASATLPDPAPSARSQLALLDLNRECQISVGTVRMPLPEKSSQPRGPAVPISERKSK